MRPMTSAVSTVASNTSTTDPLPDDASLDVGALYRTHGRTVMRWAARLGGPGIDAEDVAQDVFLVARRRLSSFAGPGKITTWLFRTTEKVVQAARRKQRLRRWLSRSSEAAATTMGAPRATPGEALERDREIAEVYCVLDRLPQRERRVLILFELEGLSTQEIGELVGARLGTIRVWLYRARARFMEVHQRLFQTRDEDLAP
jgi:RNA polymerase sigma-70 factor, ECF subfamily